MPADELEQLVGRNAHEQDWLVMLDHFGAGDSPVAIDAGEDPDGLSRIADVGSLEDIADDVRAAVGRDRGRGPFDGTEAISAGEDIVCLNVGTVSTEAGCHEAW